MRGLVLLLPGLGDALTAAPIITGAARAGIVLDALTMLAPVTEYARDLDVFAEVIELPLLTQPLRGGLGVLGLRRRRYDVVFVPFPATRWQYGAVAAAVGAKRIVIHDYGAPVSRIARALGAQPVPLRGGHRIAENERLARAAGLVPDAASYLVPRSWRATRRREDVVGLSAGSMVYKGNESRRWPLEHFLELARLQLASGRALRVFAGPSESIADDERFRALAGEVEVVRLPLRDAARSLSECRAFVGNDSGLAHLAAGLGVPTVALFGMTSPVRATPVGPAHAVRTSGCPPCHDEGSPDFRCVLGLDHACITKDLAVADVARALDAAFSGEQQADAVASQGAYRLYGRAHA